MEKTENREFTEQDFSDFEISKLEDETGIIEKYRFCRCNFAGADFSGAILSKCRFEQCNFSGANFNGTEILFSAFLNCRFRFVSFFASNLQECKMTGSDFGDADINCINIKGGDWSYTSLKDLDFNRMELERINFEGADFTNASLENCIISHCNFYQSNLLHASFKGSDLRGSDLSGIEVLDVDLHNTKVDLEQCVAIAAGLGAKYTP